jgi:hypothetical protein
MQPQGEFLHINRKFSSGDIFSLDSLNLCARKDSSVSWFFLAGWQPKLQSFGVWHEKLSVKIHLSLLARETVCVCKRQQGSDRDRERERVM